MLISFLICPKSSQGRVTGSRPETTRLRLRVRLRLRPPFALKPNTLLPTTLLPSVVKHIPHLFHTVSLAGLRPLKLGKGIPTHRTLYPGIIVTRMSRFAKVWRPISLIRAFKTNRSITWNRILALDLALVSRIPALVHRSQAPSARDRKMKRGATRGVAGKPS